VESATVGYSDLFVFMDEMGCDKKDRYQSNVYGLKGKTPVICLEVTIVAMTNKIMLVFYIVTGGVSADFL